MPPASKPKANQPCHCGSGKKYRECHAVRDEQRRRFGRQSRKLLVWVGALAAIAVVVYGLASGVPYDDKKIGAVNFSGLNASQKKVAVAGRERRPVHLRMRHDARTMRSDR